MECLLCHFRSDNVSVLKDHYLNFHNVDTKDCHFLDLFKPDTLGDDKCFECSVVFRNCRKKKNHMFLYHYNQRGGARNDRGARLNVLKRGQKLIILSISDNIYKFQAYFEIVTQQRTPDNDTFLTKNRSWITNVFCFKYFNEFLRGELKDEITKRIIHNGLTGSSWFFKRFERLNIIVVPLVKEVKSISH